MPENKLKQTPPRWLIIFNNTYLCTVHLNHISVNKNFINSLFIFKYNKSKPSRTFCHMISNNLMFRNFSMFWEKIFELIWTQKVDKKFILREQQILIAFKKINLFKCWPSVTVAGIPPTNIFLVLKSLDSLEPLGIVLFISTYQYIYSIRSGIKSPNLIHTAKKFVFLLENSLTIQRL